MCVHLLDSVEWRCEQVNNIDNEESSVKKGEREREGNKSKLRLCMMMVKSVEKTDHSEINWKVLQNVLCALL